MWKRSFVATTAALGGTVEDALAALGGAAPSAPASPDLDAGAMEIVAQLQAPQRSARAAALAKAVRDVMMAIDDRTLR